MAYASVPPDSLLPLLARMDEANRLWSELAERKDPAQYGHERIQRHIRGVLYWHTERFKSQIIGGIPKRHGLLITVADQGWLDEAKEEIVEVLIADPLIDQSWFVGYAMQTRAPELFDPMVRRLHEGEDTNSTLGHLYSTFPKRFPEVRAMVEKMRSERPDAIDENHLIRFGFRDALDSYVTRSEQQLADLAVPNPQRSERWAERRRETIHERLAERVFPLVGYTGGSTNFFGWYATNRESLRFDVASRRFAVSVSDESVSDEEGR